MATTAPKPRAVPASDSSVIGHAAPDSSRSESPAWDLHHPEATAQAGAGPGKDAPERPALDRDDGRVKWRPNSTVLVGPVDMGLHAP